MSQVRTVEYECPYCHKTFETDIYESVNTQDDYDEVERVKSGDLFKHLCPHCHTDFLIQNQFVYHDPERKFLLLLSQEDIPEAFHAGARELTEKGYRLRRCPTIQELIEKIEIFEDDMDDVVVELAKYDSFIEFINNRQGNPQDITSVEYQKAESGIIKINIRCDDKGMSFLIPLEGLEEEVSVRQDLFGIENEKFPVINSQWIIGIFEEVEKAS